MARQGKPHTDKKPQDLVAGRLNEHGAEAWNKLRKRPNAEGKSEAWLLNYALWLANSSASKD